MNLSLGKPVLALLSAACIAVPAGTPFASAATGPSIRTASTISTTDYFDPLPRGVSALGQTVDAAAIDASTLLALLTFPYHNIYGVTVAVGNAAAAGLQVVLLPLSVATLVGTNQTDQVPAYVQSTIENAVGAIPGIFQAIKAEIEYDIDLFSQLGGGVTSMATNTLDTAPRLMKASIAQTADVAALTEATEPAGAEATTAEQDETGTDAAAATTADGAAAGESTEKAATDGGDTAVSGKADSTAKSVKKPPKKSADNASAAGDDTTGSDTAPGGDSDTLRGDSGPRASTSNTGDVQSTTSAGAGANNAASTEKSGAESAQSEK